MTHDELKDLLSVNELLSLPESRLSKNWRLCWT